MLRTDEEEAKHRRVSWLELFYDLFFVVIISRLSHELVAHISWTGVFSFLFLFVAVWWVWIGSTYYNERFETEGLENRIFFFLKLFPVAGLAVFVHDGLGANSAGFALSYMSGRLIISLLWLRATVLVPLFRPVGKIFSLGFFSSIALFGISLFFEEKMRFVLWGAGLLLDLITPWFTLKEQAKFPRLSTSRLPERFGLLIIIVLGESAAGVINGLAGRQEFTSDVLLKAGLGIFIGFGFWWLYFDYISRLYPRKTVLSNILWSYLHFPLAASLAAIGAATKNLIALSNSDEVTLTAVLIASAGAVAFFALTFLELTLEKSENDPAHKIVSPLMRFIAGTIMFCYVLFFSGSVFTVLLLLASLLLLQMGYGAFVWFRKKE